LGGVGGRVRCRGEACARVADAAVCFVDELGVAGQEEATLVVGDALGVEGRCGDRAGVGYVAIVEVRLVVFEAHDKKNRDQHGRGEQRQEAADAQQHLEPHRQTASPPRPGQGSCVVFSHVSSRLVPRCGYASRISQTDT
jgi:hypothetical protein